MSVAPRSAWRPRGGGFVSASRMMVPAQKSAPDDCAPRLRTLRCSIARPGNGLCHVEPANLSRQEKGQNKPQSLTYTQLDPNHYAALIR